MRPSVVAVCLALGAAGACGGSVSSTTQPIGAREPAPSGGDPTPSGVDSPGASGMDTAGAGGTDQAPASGDTTGGGGGAFPLCQGASVDATCVACAEAACGPTLNAALSACAAFLSCFQACKCTDGSCISSCGQTSATQGCQTAATAAGTCAKASNCAGSCLDSLNLGSADGGTIVVGTPGSGSGTSSATGCAALAACCAMLPSTDQTGCNAVVSAGNATTCNNELAGFQSAQVCQ